MLQKKDKDRLQELRSIPADRLTEAEKAEKIALEEKQAELEAIASGVAEYLKDIPTLKHLTNVPIAATNQLTSDPALAMHGIMCGIRAGGTNSEKGKELLKRSGVPLEAKAASPMTEGVSADGGIFVPQVTEARILELAKTYGQARQIMQVIPQPGQEVKWPKESGMPTWSWVDENTEMTDAKLTFGSFLMTPKKGYAIVVLSKELFNDAVVNIGNYVLNKVGQKKGQAEDAQFFAGSGSPFTGISANGNSFGNVVTLSGGAGTISDAKFNEVTLGIDQAKLVGAEWLTHRTNVLLMRNLVDLNGRPLYVEANGGNPATFKGFPLRMAEYMPTSATVSNGTVALLGNYQNSLIGDVQGMEVELLREATISGTNLAAFDLVAFKVTSRVAFSAGLTEEYSRLRQAA